MADTQTHRGRQRRTDRQADSDRDTKVDRREQTGRDAVPLTPDLIPALVKTSRKIPRAPCPRCTLI